MFSVIFDKTGLNDASPTNDTRKNRLSVHYCFFTVFYLMPPVAVFSFHYQIKDHFVARFV